MENIKAVIAKNICDLRVSHAMTQAELAEKLHYSDKAVSKWERGESVPDVAVLLQIAELFGVSLDYMVHAEHGKLLPEDKSERHRRIYNHGLITAMAVVLVWLLALMIFVVIEIAWPAARLHWLAFVFAVPLSGVVWLVMNSIWFNKKRNYLIISLLMWALLAAIFVTLLNVGINVWLIFLLGVPCQLILIFGSMLKFRKK